MSPLFGSLSPPACSIMLNPLVEAGSSGSSHLLNEKTNFPRRQNILLRAVVPPSEHAAPFNYSFRIIDFFFFF